MRTKSFSALVDYATRQGMSMKDATFSDGWYYLPDKAEKHPSTMSHRKTRDFEHVSREFRPCASGKAKYYPADEYCGRTIKERI